MSGSNEVNPTGYAANSAISLELDLRVYRLSAVKKAAYRFGDRFHIHIATISGDRVHVVLTPKGDADVPSFHLGEFCNEALDQELREVVAQETEPIRRLLLAQAFSAASLIDELGDDADYHADPLNIRSDREGDQATELNA